MTNWHDMWQQNSLGFHRNDYNPLLLKYWSKINIFSTHKKQETVFLPLCGKSRDILWFIEQGYAVFGVELVEIAIRTFFHENNLKTHKKNLLSSSHSHPLWVSENITLCQGDLFSLPRNTTNATCFFDRAALVALPHSDQKAYVRQLLNLAPHLTAGMLITIEFHSNNNSAPPYSTSFEQVWQLYNPNFHVKLLYCGECPAPPSIQLQGITTAKEYVYMLTIK